MKPLKIALVSLGCPKNLVDSEMMLASLAGGGHVVGAPMDEADVIVINTCGFLAAAREESLQVIAEAVRCKHEGPASRIIVAGCMAQRDAAALHELVPEIDAVVGVNDRDEILAAVTGKRRMTLVTPHGAFRSELQKPTGSVRSAPSEDTNRSRRGLGLNSPYAERILSDSGRFRLTPRHTAYLRIAEGCSQRCTFCTIPAIRGPFRSKPMDDVLTEAAELAADGAVELNIIAQDTTAYGSDLPDKPTLADLLRRLDRIDGVRWIRLLYTYPRRFSEELIDTLAACRRVVPYVDMPLQHISDGVLKRMGRGVGRDRTEKLLHRMRRQIPGLVLRTTFIVGFPGETDADFAELLDFVRSFKFDALGAFAYSAEPGTPAVKLADQIPPQIKAERAEALMLAQQEIAFAASKARIGSDLEILVDGVDVRGRCVGRFYGQAPDIDGVCLIESRPKVGRFVTGRIKAADGYDLIVD